MTECPKPGSAALFDGHTAGNGVGVTPRALIPVFNMSGSRSTLTYLICVRRIRDSAAGLGENQLLGAGDFQWGGTGRSERRLDVRQRFWRNAPWKSRFPD